jgi:hypothetical protein
MSLDGKEEGTSGGTRFALGTDFAFFRDSSASLLLEFSVGEDIYDYVAS